MAHETAFACLVADGARARVILRHADGRFSDIARLEAVPRRRTKDTRGRVFASVGPVRAAVPEPDRDADRRAFAAELALALGGLADRKAFDRLILVAPARMLSALRQDLRPDIRARIAGQLAKDLTKHHELDLQHVLDRLVFGASVGATS
jgi:protein required for attachment to host cells